MTYWRRAIIRDYCGTVRSDTGWRQQNGVPADGVRWAIGLGYRVRSQIAGVTVLRRWLPLRMGCQRIIIRAMPPTQLRQTD